MPYLGKSPSQGVRTRFQFTPNAGTTNISGADANGITLTFTDGNYVDVYLNGVMLKAGTDYNTTTANQVTLSSGTVASDVVDIIVYDTFSLFGGTLEGNVKVNNGTFNVTGAVDFDSTLNVDGALTATSASYSSTISLTDSDVAHGMTGILPTATYGQLAPESGTEGGLRITTATEGATAYSVTATSTTPSTDGNGAVFRFRASKKSGTSEQALANTDDLMTIGNVGVEKITIKGNGDTTFDGAVTIANDSSGSAMLQVRNFATSSTGAFSGSYASEFRTVTATSTHGMLIHHAENNAARRTLDISDNTGTIASFVQGQVGIGETDPDQKLHVFQSSSSGAGIVPLIRTQVDTCGTTGDGSGIEFFGKLSGSDWGFAKIAGVNSGANHGGGIEFHTNSGNGSSASTTMTRKMVLDQEGNLGLGLGIQYANDYVDGSSGTTIVLESAGTNRGALVFASECTGGSNEILGIINFTDTANTASNFRAAAIKGHKGSGNGDAYLTFHTDNAERMRILSTGDVRFGGGNSHVPFIQSITNSGRTEGSPGYTFNGDLNTGMFQPSGASDTIAFSTAGSERVRIHSGGHVSIGKDNLNAANAGVQIEAEGDVFITAEGSEGRVMSLRRLTSDGTILDFRKDTTTVGIIGCGGSSSQPVIGSANTSAGGTAAGLRFDCANNSIQPWNVNTNALVDDTTDLGFSSMRFDDVFATNGTIQTSDKNEKQDIASMTTAELAVGKRLSTLFKTFRWKSKVTEKADKARTHSGIIAQEVKAAFEAEGLDATKYALFCSDTWWEKEISVDAVEANKEKHIEAKDAYTYMDIKYVETEGYSEKTRLGVRYPELLSFIASYNESRFTAIEARIAKLEGG